MTHEYVIATGGRVEPVGPIQDGVATALGWAADAVLAVGPDDVVRSISRGDSTFLDLAGCVVTPLPTDGIAAEALLGRAEPGAAIGTLLVDAGLIASDSVLEPGSPADLAFWGDGTSGSRSLIAVVRGGAFTEGDEHYGPFEAAP
jgi:hypothetical protein